MTQRPILVFDVNETLLDLEHLRGVFEEIFGDRAALREWFAQLILYSQTLTITGLGSDFAALGGAVLKMMGQIRGVPVGDAETARLREAMAGMPAHPDAASALRRLQEDGFRMVTLTNSPPPAGPSPLARAGLAEFFEEGFSVQPTGRFKPAAETYLQVADALAVPVSELCLVACHVWDTIGMQALGGRGALVTHGVNAPLLLPDVPQPEIVAPDLESLAAAIISRWPQPATGRAPTGGGTR